MGVPLFFGWLRRRYPAIVATIEDLLAPDGVHCGGSAQGHACDHLYLDMNGIIHQCSHPLDRPAPSSEAAMFAEVCRYIDRIVALTRPTALVYMAIDGVAPRAKMNQQRGRRFRAAMDAAKAAQPDAARAEREGRAAWAREGLGGVSGSKAEAPFDSNVITPGTRPFSCAPLSAPRPDTVGSVWFQGHRSWTAAPRRCETTAPSASGAT